MTDSMNAEGGDVSQYLNDAYPTPTTREPDIDELEMAVFDGECPATDGCIVETDGCCPHGHVSWLRYLGIV